MTTKQSAPSTRLNARLDHLRKHHNQCLFRHMEYEKHQIQSSGSPNPERETSSAPSLPSELLESSKCLPSGSPNKDGEISSLSELSPEPLAASKSLDSQHLREDCKCLTVRTLQQDPKYSTVDSRPLMIQTVLILLSQDQDLRKNSALSQTEVTLKQKPQRGGVGHLMRYTQWKRR
ncbi:uncharacterized protein [Cebidichthys violaceus]|uniref:uncharacterized protein isoform X4 n=1 Tax=Cebidichthys violaceus TaxID=271503 RepID=UPI0035CC8588